MDRELGVAPIDTHYFGGNLRESFEARVQRLEQMQNEREELFARFAVELGHITSEQLNDAFATQKSVARLGLEETLSHVLVGKGFITHEQLQDIENRIALQTGEGRRVGGFEVVDKLGQGGMGAVYKARRVLDDLMVALKILPPSMATPLHVARFRREAEVARTLKHPNIVSYVEFGHDDRRECYYCALELVEGEDVASMIRRLGQLKQSDTIVIARQIADALQHAYENGLVHRDIKPENIILTPAGIAKLLDLGLARPTTSGSSRHTHAGVFIGSPDYASPEQSRAAEDMDTRSDIYSLGASMYHMVTGKPPFTGGTAIEVLKRHLTAKPVAPNVINPKISKGLNRIILKTLQKDPADRYETPEELAQDLARLEGGRQPTASVQVSLVKRAAAVSKLRKMRTTRRPSLRRGPPLQLLVAVGVGVLALAIGTWLLLAGSSSPSEVDLAVPETVVPDIPPPLVVKTDAPLPKQDPLTAEGLFKLAEKFERENPSLRSESAARYDEVIKEFPESYHAARARLKVTELRPVGSAAAGGGEENDESPERPAVPLTVWLEGEAPERHTFVRHEWYDDVDYGLFSANDWISHYSHDAPGKVVYTFEVKVSAKYTFYLRANPTSRVLRWQLDWSEWQEVDFSRVPESRRVNVAAERDHRYLAWVEIGDIQMRDGTHRLEFRCSGGTGNHGAIDCICFTTDRAYTPSGAARPSGITVALDSRALDAKRPPKGAPTEALMLDGHGYKLYRPMKWADAKAICERMGGHLATIESHHEADFVRRMAADLIKDAWIGLEWRHASSAWKWVDGEVVRINFWGDPSVAAQMTTPEARGALSMEGKHLWVPRSAGTNNHFVCEWDEVEVPKETLVLWNGESRPGGTGGVSDEPDSVKVVSGNAHSGASCLEWRCEGTGWRSARWQWAGRNSRGRDTEMGRFGRLTFWMKYSGQTKPDSFFSFVSSGYSDQSDSSRANIRGDEVDLFDGAWHKVEIDTMTFVRYIDDKYANRDKFFDPNRTRLFHLGAWSREEMSFKILIDDIAFEN